MDEEITLQEKLTDEEEEEKAPPRDINKLLDLPYSEMTEEEIALVIEYKAAIKARDEAHEEAMRLLKEGMEREIAANQEMADKAQAMLEELTRHAINRFEDATYGEA